jgi:hypothetical protein
MTEHREEGIQGELKPLVDKGSGQKLNEPPYLGCPRFFHILQKAPSVHRLIVATV